MNTENSITNQKGYDDSLTENSTKHAANADSSYDGLSQDEVRRLKEMAPELRDALLRLRRNIHSRQQERDQAAETRELSRLLGVKTPQDAVEERNAQNLQAAMAEQARRDREAVKKKFLCQQGLTEAGIPRLFHSATMENIIRQGLPEALEYPRMRICSYLENIEKCCDLGTGLILTGPCGTLKTTFACSIMLEAFAHGIEARFELVMSMLDRLVMLEKSNKDEYCRTMQKLCSVPILVLDDLGAEGHHADFVRSKLEQIIFQRHANGRALIITTNLSPAGLAKLYPGRIMERLRERCLVLEHNCASLRGKNVFSVIA